LFVHPATTPEGAGDSKTADAMRQAAEAMTEASQQIRRSAVAQSQVARRLGPLVNQPPVGNPGPGGVVEPDNGAGRQQEAEDDEPPAAPPPPPTT
jgi:hypothetical protein